MTTRAHEIRERFAIALWSAWEDGISHYPEGGHRPDSFGELTSLNQDVWRKRADETTNVLLARVEELEKAVKPLADTKIRGETVTEIVSTIIETTGDGPFADWIAELLTNRVDDARTALETPDED